jgi:hypothetical protein
MLVHLVILYRKDLQFNYIYGQVLTCKKGFYQCEEYKDLLAEAGKYDWLSSINEYIYSVSKPRLMKTLFEIARLLAQDQNSASLRGKQLALRILVEKP